MLDGSVVLLSVSVVLVGVVNVVGFMVLDISVVAVDNTEVLNGAVVVGVEVMLEG